MAARSLKRSIPYLCLGGGACAGLAIIFPHTFGLEYYKNLMTAHDAWGKEEVVDLEIMQIVEKIKKDYGWPKRSMEASEAIYVFPSTSLEICHLGTAKTKWGSYLGIPKYYLSKYHQNDQYWTELFKLLNVDSSSQSANNLRQSCNMSEAAKSYAIAREIRLCKSYQMFYMVGGAQVAVGCFYLVPNVISTFLPFPGAKLLSVLSLLPLMYFGSFSLLKKASRHSVYGAEKHAASLSYEIALGGLEYYDSAISRQKILHNITDKNAISKGYILDLVKQSWMDSYLTLEERKENLEKMIDTLYTNKTDSR